jgi:hypothetical protein
MSCVAAKNEVWRASIHMHKNLANMHTYVPSVVCVTLTATGTKMRQLCVPIKFCMYIHANVFEQECCTPQMHFTYFEHTKCKHVVCVDHIRVVYA